MRNLASARRALVILVAGAVTSCSPNPSPGPTATSSAPTGPPPTAAPQPSPSLAPQAGGTIYVLSQADQFDQVDPQRVYSGEDEAFFGATIFRSLESYAYSPDAIAGTTLTPDLATDLGRPTDGGRTWSFTLRDGVTFQDGSPITCADVKYGVSRTFATDVINQGPTYAILDLDVPKTADGTSRYPGPYSAKPAQQALFDKAIDCPADGRTITFHLNRPIGDFNYATALGMSPVPKAADTGEIYGTVAPFVQSTGPYKVDTYTTGNGGKMTLVRNPHWNPASDPIRKAYPDSWEVDFGIDQKVIDQRLIAARGADAFAVTYGPLDPADVRTLFSDARTATTAYADRAISDFDPYVRYLWIDVAKVPNLKVRQAMLVALDRAAIRALRGGELYGDYADGVLKPTIGIDYAPTGLWDTVFGATVPPSGDPDLARSLLAAAGKPNAALTFTMADTPANQAMANIVKSSLGAAGFTVDVKPLCTGYGCGIVFDPAKAADFGTGGWGSDWPSASTVIPALFTQAGGWDLSHVDDAPFNAAIDDAMATTDRVAQAAKWQALNRQAVENAWVIPTFFSRSQTIAGTRVGPVYRWPAYSSWPYGAMYVTP
jgi:peptide/nickel transport system substrate-binding protein